MTMRAPDVIGIPSRMSKPLLNQCKQLRAVESAGVLRVTRIHDIGGRAKTPPIIKSHAQFPFAIDMGHQFAFAQISEHGGCRLVLDPESDAAARAAPIQAEHKSGQLRRPSMHMRIDAEGPMIAAHKPQSALDKIKPGPPHQRPIAKHPHSAGPKAEDPHPLCRAYKRGRFPARAIGRQPRACPA